MKKSLLLSFVFALALVMQAWAQEGRLVSGQITSAIDGSPLPGVTVLVEGTSIGASTDVEGRYSINVPAGRNTLVFSYIGFGEQKLNIGSRTTIDVALSQDDQQLSEVIITGYGTTIKKEYVGAASTVDGSKIEDRPLPSVDQLLQGQVAGLQAVGASGQPGANVAIRIRGTGSINAGSDPLYVVDGVIINTGDVSRLSTTSNQLAGINPNDIESITVLKDAASTAIYGSRGANGVIIITTKKGRAGRTRFQLSSEIGYTELVDVPEAGDFLNAQEWLDLTREGLVNAGYGPNVINPYLESLGEGSGVDTDWRDLVTRAGTQQQYNISASGGNEKTTFYISGGFFNQEAPIIGSELERVSGSISLTHKVNESLSFFTSINASHVDQQAPSNGGAFANPVGAIGFLLPTQVPYNPDGTINISREGNLGFTGNYNPLYLAENDVRDLSNSKIIGAGGLEWDIVDNLKFTSQIGVDYISLEERMFWNPIHGDGRNYGGYGFDYYTRIFNWTFTNLLNYRFEIPGIDKLQADLTIGYEAQESNAYYITSSANNFPSAGGLTSTVVAASPVDASATGADYSFSSLISRGSINYADRYILTGSYRRDGSSRFGLDERFGNFWSVGAAWNIDQEDFMEATADFLSSLKLRASYGVNGNGDIGNYTWRPLFDYGVNYNQQSGGAFTNLGNTGLTWEKNKPFNVGVDVGFWKDRLTFAADYYVRTTSDLLFNRPLSGTVGVNDAVLLNVGELQNRGFELSIGGYPITGGAFQWQTNFNFATNENEITKLPDGEDIISGAFILREGEDFRTFYVRQWAGVDPQTGDPLWFKDASRTETTTEYSQAERVLYESASPDAFGGWSNTFTYKGFVLETLINYNFGNYVREGWEYYLADGAYPYANKYRKVLDRWQEPGDITDVPRYQFGLNNQSNAFSTRFLYRGDYIRLRNVTLGYELKNEWISKAALTRAYIYVRGTNLLTKTFDENLPVDPETGVNSTANANIPTTRVLTVGVNLSF